MDESVDERSLLLHALHDSGYQLVEEHRDTEEHRDLALLELLEKLLDDELLSEHQFGTG